MLNQDVRRLLGTEDKPKPKAEEKKVNDSSASLEGVAAEYTSEEMRNLAIQDVDAAQSDVVIDEVDVASVQKAPEKRIFDFAEAKKAADEARQAILDKPEDAMRAQGNTTNETAWKLLA